MPTADMVITEAAIANAMRVRRSTGCLIICGASTVGSSANAAKIAVIEGDEYLASPIDRRPKFHLYHPNIAIISGIAWDHINVFPTFDHGSNTWL